MSSASNKILQAAAGNVETEITPVGIDFDGANDYLSRSSDLVGATDGKTFTFSAWVYISGSASTQRIYHSDDGTGWPRFSVLINSGASVTFASYPTDGTARLNITSAANSLSKNTWHHILASVDMASQANSKIYINDENVTFSVSTFTNTDLSFSNTAHKIGAETSSAGLVEGRLAGVYLDYTYRDLSVEANRRLFIDDDGLYVTPPTSGIINVPMDDPADPGRNDGTGGDFTLNGVVAQSGRGPNQYNAAASTFDGSADYLTRTSLTGVADSKTFTFSCFAKSNTFNNDPIISVEDAGNQKFVVRFSNGGSFGYLNIIGQQAGSATNVLNLGDTDAKVYLNRWHSLQVSIDLSDTNKRHVFIDGEEVTGLTYNTYTNTDIDFTTADYAIGAPAGIFNSQFDGELSDVWFDTSYMDLTSSNPFYDSETGKPKDLGASGELPTGSAPLIYTPLRADDAGNNLGTGGDFTVNSGPYIGARGPSEFWGESAKFNGSNQGLFLSGTPTGASSAVTGFTAVFSYKPTATNVAFPILTLNDSGNSTIISIKADNNKMYARTPFYVFADTDNGVINGLANTWINVLFTITKNGSWQYFINGVDRSEGAGTFSSTGNADLTNIDNSYIGYNQSSEYANGNIGFLYAVQEYIDFSQEANRLKFIDAFGNPLDLGEDGSLPTGSQPLIYLNEGFHLGTNLGSGGNFTPQNTPTDGGYVKG